MHLINGLISIMGFIESAMKSVISIQELVHDLKELGVHEGDKLNVKVSLKSIGAIEGGADGLISALLIAVGASGTIFGDCFLVGHPLKNVKKEPLKYLTDDNSVSYAGAFVNAMAKDIRSKRSPHPIQKFVAIGADADWVLEHNVESRPYSVLFKLIENGGKNLKIGDPAKVYGVGTTHCAIESLGWRQLMPKRAVTYKDDNGDIKLFLHNWPSGCMNAFDKIGIAYNNKVNWRNEGKVGNAYAMLSDMRATYDAEVEAATANPNMLRCDDPNCVRCRIDWKEHHNNRFFQILKYLVTFKFRSAYICLEHLLFYSYEPNDSYNK